MKVLVACEESQAVTKELRKLGHEAFSADIQECSGGHPEWHIKGDVLEVLEGWDMIIAFPPCTHLCVSGAKHFEEKRKDGRQRSGIDFFMKMINAPCHKIAVENPVGIMSSEYRKPDQIIQPWQFGDNAQKTTCLWLKNLDHLKATVKEKPHFEYHVTKSGKRMEKWMYEIRCKSVDIRGGLASKTFPGIAKAMAEQWTKPQKQVSIFDEVSL